MPAIEIISGDITQLDTDAIVISAHKHLVRGRGLSAQIFDMIGAPLVEACERLGDCPMGEARITDGYNLAAKHIIHTVAPMWTGGDQWGAIDLGKLRQCYESSLKLAAEQGVKRLAFTSLGSGANKFPQELVSQLALDVLHQQADQFEQLVVCLGSASSKHIWETFEQQRSCH